MWAITSQRELALAHDWRGWPQAGGQVLGWLKKGSPAVGPKEVAGLGRGVTFSHQVACVDCDHRSLCHVPVPLRALPGSGVPDVKLTKREVIN